MSGMCQVGVEGSDGFEKGSDCLRRGEIVFKRCQIVSGRCQVIWGRCIFVFKRCWMVWLGKSSDSLGKVLGGLRVSGDIASSQIASTEGVCL